MLTAIAPGVLGGALGAILGYLDLRFWRDWEWWVIVGIFLVGMAL